MVTLSFPGSCVPKVVRLGTALLYNAVVLSNISLLYNGVKVARRVSNPGEPVSTDLAERPMRAGEQVAARKSRLVRQSEEMRRAGYGNELVDILIAALCNTVEDEPAFS